jgi:membrane associated rhomboid family serine protease
MAYGSRSYGGGYRFNWRGLLTPAIKIILISCTAVFLIQTIAQLLGGNTEKLIEFYFGLVPYLVIHGFVYQLFTYLFLHGGILHLLINMFVLWMFGADIERAWGMKRFFFYYFLCGVGAGVINVAVKVAMDPAGKAGSAFPTIGASGAIYGVLIAAAVLFPDREIWLIPFPITLPMKAYVAIMAALEFFGTLGSSGDNVSHVCHLGGMLVGYIYLRRGNFFFGFRNRYSDWKRRRLKRKFEVYVRDHKEKPPSQPGSWVN